MQLNTKLLKLLLTSFIFSLMWSNFNIMILDHHYDHTGKWVLLGRTFDVDGSRVFQLCASTICHLMW